MAKPRTTPVAVSIAGSDSGGGAGVQADLLTFSALGVFGTTAITCVTAQNPDGVSDVYAVPPQMVAAQLQQIAGFFPVGAAKTGMLFSRDIIREVVRFFQEHPDLHVVVDPVMVATSGARLLHDDAVTELKTGLLPRATLITPNLDEAAVLLEAELHTRPDIIEGAVELARRHHTAVLLKGGHIQGERLIDVLAEPGRRPRVFSSTRIHHVDTHGSGCTLSAAIAACLARGEPLDAAVAGARRYLRRGMRHPVHPGPRAFIAHR